MNKLLIFFILSAFALSGCSFQLNEPTSTQVAFYPPGGMGNVVQYETLETPFHLPVRYEGLEEVDVQIYTVDKESFYENTIGAFAAFEGHIDVAAFKEAGLIYNERTDIQADPENKRMDDMPLGYLDLPIEEEGYYYLAFRYSNLESGRYHILLHIGPKDIFNY